MASYGHSYWHARIRKPTAYPVADAAVDTIVARDHAINNVNHYADIMGQVRANWITQSGAYIENDPGSSKLWRQMWYAGQFPISLLPDGSSYRVRVRVAGCAENASYLVRFAVTLCATNPGAIAGVVPGTVATDAIWRTGSITSTTPAWLTGTSDGDNGWENMISMTATEAAACVRRTATVLDTNGVGVEVVQAMVHAVVWGYDDDVAHHARLYGVSLEEWPG